ncbi:hypothetical protein C0991_009107 [Blastosporella zonata]|nr:hypothetical protein C0991_009107 [Blastosporella zonata]
MDFAAQQFSVAFDLYLAIRAGVSAKVDAALQRNVPRWRLKNACPACTYKLENEGNLMFKLLFTMDGNDSLKWLRNASKPIPSDETTKLALGKSKSRHDSRTVPGNRYLTREEVDRWAKAALEETLAHDSPASSSEQQEDNPCAGHWTNMVNEVTAKM